VRNVTDVLLITLADSAATLLSEIATMQPTLCEHLQEFISEQSSFFVLRFLVCRMFWDINRSRAAAWTYSYVLAAAVL
jgi:hypothetical protein